MNHQLTYGTRAYLLEHDVLYLTNESEEYIFNDQPSRFIVELLQNKKSIDELSVDGLLKHRAQAYILRDWLVKKGLLHVEENNIKDENTHTKDVVVDLRNTNGNHQIRKSIKSVEIEGNKMLNVRTYGYGENEQETRIKWTTKFSENLANIMKKKCVSINDTKIEAINFEVHSNRLDIITHKANDEIGENELIIPIIYNSKLIEIGPFHQKKYTKYVDILNERVGVRTGAVHTIGENKPFVPPSSFLPDEKDLATISSIVVHIIEEKLMNLHDLDNSQKYVWTFNRDVLDNPKISADFDSYLVEREIHVLEPIEEEQCLESDEIKKINIIPEEYGHSNYILGKVPTLDTLRRGTYKRCDVIDGGRRIYSTGKTRTRIKPFVDIATGVLQKLELTSLNNDIYSYGGSRIFGAANKSMKNTENTSRTTGFPVSAAGKGRTAYQSQVSCIAEALERYSANYPILKTPEIKSSYADMPDKCIHPNTILQYSKYQYENREKINDNSLGVIHQVPKLFDENREIFWSPIINLINTSDSRLLPTAMLGFNYTNNLQEGTAICCSNGLASGNSVCEAMVQAIYEIIERDSCAIWWYNKLKVNRAFIPENLDHYISNVIQRLVELDRNFNLLYLPTDFPVHVIACVSHKQDGSQICVGLGSHCDYSIAVSRALTEMYQMIVGESKSKDRNINKTGNGGIDFIVQQWLFNEIIADHDYLVANEAIDPKLLESMNSEIHFDYIEEELSWLLSTFEAKGFDVFGANFTAETIGFPVAKVFIPGMRHFWPRFAPGRLFEVPVELGYLDQATSESDLNEIGFFF